MLTGAIMRQQAKRPALKESPYAVEGKRQANTVMLKLLGI
jgi:hypothetical protein